MSTLRIRSFVGAMAMIGALVALTAPAPARAQGSVAGRVTDQASGQPVVDARVFVLGTALRGQTNAEGRYTLSGVPAGPATVRVSAIGYAAGTRTVTVAAGETASADLVLTLSAYTLDAIVSTATGDLAKRAVGNSITTLRADSLVPFKPITNMNDLLGGGKVAGVHVLPGNLTGSGGRVRIRGTNSLSLNNEPIYVIDGIRMESAVNSSSIGIGGTNPSRVNDINPDEIESVDFIKGPSAAALYGTAAVNGVIVMKTKRGQPGAPRWNVYSELGVIGDYNKYPDAYRGWTTGSTVLNATQCLLTNTVRPAGDPARCVQDSVTAYNLFEDPEATPNGTGWRGQVGAQVSGGSEAVRYFISGEYEDERGPLRMPRFAYGRVVQARRISEVPYEQYRPNARERVSLRANVQTTVSPKLDLATNMSFITSTQRLPQTDNNTTGLLSNALGGKGSKDTVLYGYRAFTPHEFFAETVTQDIQRFIGSGTANWRPNSWLAAHVASGLDFTNRVDEDLCRRDECVDFGTIKSGFKEDNRTKFFQYTVNSNAAATFQLNPSIQSKTTVGFQFFHSVFNRNGAEGEDLPPGATTVTPAAILDADETTSESKTLGLFVEQMFSRNDRLFVTGALRRDDNSAFGVDFNAVYYPKFSVSWVVSEEPFFSPPSWLSSLRLRGAIGAAGQQPEPGDALRFFTPTNSSVENVDSPALVFSSLGNPTLKPERAREIEAGFDVAFLESRVSLDFTFYHKRTRDALIARILPPSAGAAASRFENIGAMRNSGVEALVNAILFSRPRFGWDLSLNASYNSNKIESMGDVPPIRGTTIWQIQGSPVNSYYQTPYTFSDLDNNGVITANEIVMGDSAAFVGPQNPKVEMSLSTGFDLFNRRVRVSGLLDYKGGHYQLNGSDRIRCESRLNCDGLVDVNAPLWKQARVVALRETAARSQYGFIEKADFLRFRELSVTYQLPDVWARAMRAQRVSITAAGRNLFRLTDYSGMDPESNYFDDAVGVVSDFQTAPPPTYWTFRVNIGF